MVTTLTPARHATVSTSPADTPTVRWVDCSHKLGTLPCMNHKPHKGDGRGCIHHSTSGFRDEE
ncbi:MULTISPECIES: hypothetical protein [Actinomycetes]|jgi:hypothetical protein|uniref:Uncharacterized protein n=1 Tax=Nocardioides currus TaxID=2133958 RepID=A0A2R7YSW1_9ACTN|nr:hypothetical protein [Nocardioides currus]PUA79462.1 hypothetical protein C7S10_19010 [Nocardioides currus]